MTKRRRKPAVVLYDETTQERRAHNEFRSAGMAKRVIPVIETLANSGWLTPAQFDALDYYRDQASRAEDDEAQQNTLSPERIMGGGGQATITSGPIPKVLIATPAILETSRIERDLGSLRDIARAIAVQDWTLTRWCIEKFGGRERYDAKGRFVAIVPVNEKRHVQLARLELRYAAGLITR